MNREPRLAVVENDARAGRFGSSRDLLELRALPPDRRVEATRHLRHQQEELGERLGSLVGPSSQRDEIVLSSHIAREVAYLHLSGLAPKQSR